MAVWGWVGLGWVTGGVGCVDVWGGKRFHHIQFYASAGGVPRCDYFIISLLSPSHHPIISFRSIYRFYIKRPRRSPQGFLRNSVPHVTPPGCRRWGGGGVRNTPRALRPEKHLCVPTWEDRRVAGDARPAPSGAPRTASRSGKSPARPGDPTQSRSHPSLRPESHGPAWAPDIYIYIWVPIRIRVVVGHRPPNSQKL